MGPDLARFGLWTVSESSTAVLRAWMLGRKPLGGSDKRGERATGYVFLEALDMPKEPVKLTAEQERQLARLILICFKQWNEH